MQTSDRLVNFYFVLNEHAIRWHDNHQFWYTTGAILPGDYLDFNSIPWTVARKIMYHSDYIIGCMSNQEPVYLKNRKSSHCTLVNPEEMIYIKLASLPISG